jgi:hypothetical protein
MWLRVPETGGEELWEGPLEPDPDAADGQERAWFGKDATPESDRDLTRDLPVVSIGRPEVWSLPEVYPPEKMPPDLRVKLAEADFYLVRLACSFRPRQNDTEIEWARLSVSLLPAAGAAQPIAFDLHPVLLTQETRRNVKVSLSPTVKFLEVEAGVGAAEFGFEYPELQPTISAAGIGEAQPSWDFQAARGMPVVGSKWMHMLVKAPTASLAGHAELHLVADVTSGGFRLPVLARTGHETAEPLSARLW